MLGCRSPSEPANQTPRAGPRVVTLTPSATEIVAAVAGPDVLVGVDRFSDYPPAVTALPRTGDFVNPTLEAILRLRPDLVVLDRVQSKVDEGLHAAGVTTLVLPMTTVDDVRAGIAAVGNALGRAAEAEAVLAALEGELAAVARAAARARADRPAVRALFIVDRELGGLGNMVAVGPGAYLDELLQLAGGANVLADSPVQFPRISVEEVLRRAPDVILDAVHTESTTQAASDWNVLAAVPAVQRRRVHILGDAMHTHPGPRLGHTVRIIADALYPAPP
jgi:iron complex transport system substrate-binding protein